MQARHQVNIELCKKDFISDWEANYPGLALTGQVFNITLKNDPASRS